MIVAFDLSYQQAMYDNPGEFDSLDVKEMAKACLRKLLHTLLTKLPPDKLDRAWQINNICHFGNQIMFVLWDDELSICLCLYL